MILRFLERIKRFTADLLVIYFIFSKVCKGNRGGTKIPLKKKKNNGNRYTATRLFFLRPEKTLEIICVYTNL